MPANKEQPASAKNSSTPVKHIPKRGTIPCDDFMVEVVTLDERVLFGRREYKVEPVSGGGQRWISAARFKELP
jgi:hypothetical protein